MVSQEGDFKDPSIWYKATGNSIHVLWYNYSKSLGLSDNEQIYEVPTSSMKETVIDFAGDVNMADDVATTEYMENQKQGLLDCFSANLLMEMQTADIMMVNNEFSYTTQGTAIKGKAYTFRGNPARVTQLKNIGVDFVNVANNHVYDYGEVGLLDTLNTLKNASIPYVGAGKDLDEASTPLYYIANGRKIAFVSATQIERSYNYTKEATKSSPGVMKTLNPDKFVQEIASTKKNADIVIVIVHWGTEGNAAYGKDQTALAKAFVDAGADLIVGGHTHCLQGIEYVDNVPVYYSLGNYWFASTSQMPADYDTGLAQARIQADGSITIKFLPCKFEAGVTRLLDSADEKAAVLKEVADLSSSVSLKEDGNIQKK